VREPVDLLAELRFRLICENELVLGDDEGAHAFGPGQLVQGFEIVRGQKGYILENYAVLGAKACLVSYSIHADRIEQVVMLLIYSLYKRPLL
jgi:hypothetical protein